MQELARRIDGRVFDYLLTRFTEPNELFGPFDIRKLREGELVTNTEGMLPEAAVVFLDELLNANSAILNSLLMVLNERVFRRGRETRSLPLLMVVGASNRLPEDDALAALFDRFLLRVRCDNVPADRLGDVLTAGWKLDQRPDRRAAPRCPSRRSAQVQPLVVEVDLVADPAAVCRAGPQAAAARAFPSPTAGRSSCSGWWRPAPRSAAGRRPTRPTCGSCGTSGTSRSSAR